LPQGGVKAYGGLLFRAGKESSALAAAIGVSQAFGWVIFRPHPDLNDALNSLLMVNFKAQGMCP
jgi:hypothetical protein